MATQPKDDAEAPRFRIYRGADAPAFSETSCMEVAGLTDVIVDGITRTGEAGAEDGNEVKLLFAMPGMSLTYAWFKSGFPLPLHTHNADCLYYIIAGSLRLGTEELGRGDGFFVRAAGAVDLRNVQVPVRRTPR